MRFTPLQPVRYTSFHFGFISISNTKKSNKEERGVCIICSGNICMNIT